MARLAQKREFYIPAHYTEKREGPTKGTEIFLFTDKKGRPCAKGFRGRAQKPTFNYYYADEGQREDSIARWIDGEIKEANTKQERRDRLRKPHSLKVGDILSSSWGWEQTNVDFYEVTALPSKCFVELRKLAAPISEMGGMQGKTAPLKGDYTSVPFRKKPDGENVIKMNSYVFARPWDGTEKFVSWYA